MKKITNLNVLNALIRDEKMAHMEYKQLATNRSRDAGGDEIRKTLMEMSADELRHAHNLMRYKQQLIQTNRM